MKLIKYLILPKASAFSQAWRFSDPAGEKEVLNFHS